MECPPVNPPMTSDLEHALRQHGASIRALAAALLRDPDDAEDAVQDTWLLAMERPPSQPGPLGGWLHTVLRTAAAKLKRSRHRRAERERFAASTEAQVGEDV